MRAAWLLLLIILLSPAETPCGQRDNIFINGKEAGDSGFKRDLSRLISETRNGRGAQSIGHEIERRLGVKYAAVACGSDGSPVCFVNSRPFMEIGFVKGGAELVAAVPESGLSASAAAGEKLLRFSLSLFNGYRGGLRALYSAETGADSWAGEVDRECGLLEAHAYPGFGWTASAGYKKGSFGRTLEYSAGFMSLSLSRFSRAAALRRELFAEIGCEYGRLSQGGTYGLLLLKGYGRAPLIAPFFADISVEAQRCRVTEALAHPFGFGGYKGPDGLRAVEGFVFCETAAAAYIMPGLYVRAFWDGMFTDAGRAYGYGAGVRWDWFLKIGADYEWRTERFYFGIVADLA